MRNYQQSRTLRMTTCCTATEFSALQLFYLDSNNTATQKVLPNMIVEGYSGVPLRISRLIDHRLCSRDAQCFSFQIPSDVHADEVESANLWLYKLPDPMDSHNQTFVISELAHWDPARKFPKRSPLAIHETPVGEGWVRVGLQWATRRWVEHREWRHVLHVSCKTCSGASVVAGSVPRQPFIVVDVSSNGGGKRVRRNINCSAGVTDCCRERLYVNFADIEWDDWIIYPPGYHAYFCRGSCTSVATIAQGSQHNYVLRVS
uniref:TGF-beta family profile domain-containing protein n=1 Tax=Phlebotomus papatasi TaxID=29031 RepID=A0A1B0EYE3_PHLPP